MIRKRNLYLGIISAALVLGSCANENLGYYEEGAVKELDLLTENIGKLNSCSFTLTSSEEILDGSDWITTYKETDAYINGPDQMYFYSIGDIGRRGVWINQGELSVFLFDEDKYQTEQVPKNLLRTIDSVNSTFKFQFPAADFFYPSFTDDVILFTDSLFLNEDRDIDGEMCKEVFGKSAGKELYILIDAQTHLPKQLEIYHISENGLDKSYVATFSNWVEDPNLPAKLFAFTPPENAVESEILKKK